MLHVILQGLLPASPLLGRRAADAGAQIRRLPTTTHTPDLPTKILPTKNLPTKNLPTKIR